MTLEELAGEHILDCTPRNVTNPIDHASNGIAWSMDDKVYMLFEDPNDGYRSSAAPLLCADGPAYAFGEWNPDWIRRPVFCKWDGAGILEVIDTKTGHVWMRLGTDNEDDYYPSFVGEWNPMPPESA